VLLALLSLYLMLFIYPSYASGLHQASVDDVHFRYFQYRPPLYGSSDNLNVIGAGIFMAWIVGLGLPLSWLSVAIATLFTWRRLDWAKQGGALALLVGTLLTLVLTWEAAVRLLCWLLNSVD
jgi:hypothetical protein